MSFAVLLDMVRALFQQRRRRRAPVLVLVLVKTVLLFNPAHLPLLIQTSESAQTADSSVQSTAEILLARVAAA